MPVSAAPAPAATPGRTLLLAPPSLAAHEDALRAAFAAHDRASTDLQMLDRVAAGLATLPPAAYARVLVLTDADGARRDEARRLLGRRVYARLVPAMRPAARLAFQHGRASPAEAREAILAGLVDGDGAFEKLADDAETAVPLRLPRRSNNDAAPPPPIALDLADLDDDGDGDDDDLIDEDALLTQEDLQRRPAQPTNCEPKKRRRPCKDCTCGLAAKLEADDKARRAQADAGMAALKLDANDLNELDFTVRGKTGSCNNCSLGDAFRCSTCPYIGLPPFKPGDEVRILGDLVQL